MADDMLALLCLSGLESEEFLDHALARLVGPGWRFTLLYVIDTRPAEEIGYLRQSLFRGRLSAERQAEMTGAEDQAAQEVIAEARAYLLNRRPDADVTTRVARGRPEQEIIRATQETGAALLVVGARYKAGLNPTAGPHNVGHVARFILDHATCDVLLLRAPLTGR